MITEGTWYMALGTPNLNEKQHVHPLRFLWAPLHISVQWNPG
jgi:hypothetical protein